MRAPSSTTLLALFALHCGCTSAPAGASPSFAPTSVSEEGGESQALPEGDGQFVLVWFDAELHRVPDDPSPLRAYDFGAAPRETRPGQVYVGRRLAVRGPWVRIAGVREWLDDENHSLHCIGSDVFDGRGLDITVWVHERDLAPVLSEELTVRHEDGTSIALRPGVPIIAGRPWVAGYSLPVEAPEAKVGWAYTPENVPPSFEPQLEGGSLFAARSFMASLGGQPVPWTRPVWDYGETRLATLFTAADGRRLLYRRRCGEFVFEVEGEFETLPPGGVLGSIGGAAREAQRAGTVRAGTPLVWPDKSRAGTAFEDIERVDLAPGSEPLTCVAIPVGRELQAEGYRGEQAQVCVETAKIEASSLR